MPSSFNSDVLVLEAIFVIYQEFMTLAYTSWKILEKFPDSIVFGIFSINSSVKPVHQQTLETNKVRKKLDEAQLVFL